MYIIKNATVHIGDGTVLKNSDILTEGKLIKKIGKNLSCEEAQIINASECEVFPGFIDPVSGIGAMGIPSRYPDNDERTNPVMPEMNLKYSIDPDEVNAQEFYKSGITTIGLSPTANTLMGGQIAVCKTAPQKMSERIIKEHAGLRCSVTNNIKESFGSGSQLPMTKMGIFHLFEETLRAARAEKEDKRTAKQRAVIDVFDNQKMQVFCSAGSKNEIDGLLHIMKDEKVQLNLVDGYCFADSLRQIKEKRVGIVLGNLSSLSQISKNDVNLSKIKELIENGNRIAFTNTNGGYSEGREVFIWTAIEVYRAGIPEEEVVKMMCLYPAEMLGIDHLVGTLEEGKEADISVFTGNPVTTYAAKVVHSMVNGEVLF